MLQQRTFNLQMIFFCTEIPGEKSSTVEDKGRDKTDISELIVPLLLARRIHISQP